VPRVCTVCTHPLRAQIDAALSQGSGSLRSIAAQFGVSLTALLRHRDDHLPAAVTRSADAQRQADALDVARILTLNLRLADEGLRRAFLADDLRAVSSFIGRRNEVASILSRMPIGVDEARLRAAALSEGLDPDAAVAAAMAIVARSSDGRR
jgi:hypothetical protein